MSFERDGWQALRPGSIDQLPTAPGVFELGNLVRNVLLVGGEPDRPLREVVREALAAPGIALQARCLRFHVTDDPQAAVQARLADYRAGHAGSLPPEQPRRPSLVDASARRPGPARSSSRAPAAPVHPPAGRLGGALRA